jgi:hypothetical protein
VESKKAFSLEISTCSDHVPYWIDHYCLTYDNRLPGEKIIPFDLFPRQIEFLIWLHEREEKREDGLVEKSRDMGATYLCCAYALHGWLFRRGFSAGFGSRKLEFVDKLGDMDTIFEKIRFMLYGLPLWMMPPKFKRTRDDKIKVIVNPSMESSITGEGGDDIGRGGRKSLFVVDEAAHLEHPDMVDASLSENTDVRIDVSTPNGIGNSFWRKRFRLPEQQIFILDWRDDPRKNEEWYAKQKCRLDPVVVASQIDRDYSASIEGVTIPAAWVQAAIGLPLPSRGQIVAGLDVAAGGGNKSVYICRQGPVVLPDRILMWNQDTTQGAWRAKEEAIADRAMMLNFDGTGVGFGIRTGLEMSGDLPFLPRAVMTGGAPSERTWDDGRTSKERFLNLRAELWWLLRERFKKSFEVREKGISHPPDECISIPFHPQLTAELSQPLHFITQASKVKVESKEDLSKRGIKSPDYADALVLCFMDVGLWDVPAPEGRPGVMSRLPREIALPRDEIWGVEGEEEDSGDGINWDRWLGM